MTHYVEPLWASEGMPIWLPWNPEKNRPGRSSTGTALRCTVAVAAGHHVRIVNEHYGVDNWYALTSLYVPPDDPHAQ